MLSVGLVGTWVYHLYDKTQYSQRRTEIYIKDSMAVAEGIRDSLQKIYTSTINDLDTRLDSTRTTADSIKVQLDVKLGEIYKLKGEIDNILKNRGATKADLQLARQKIAELQDSWMICGDRKIPWRKKKEDSMMSCHNYPGRSPGCSRT
jgi:hypothetical protein